MTNVLQLYYLFRVFTIFNSQSILYVSHIHTQIKTFSLVISFVRKIKANEMMMKKNTMNETNIFYCTIDCSHNNK